MSHQPQEDFEFIHRVFRDIKEHSRYHRYLPLHKHQDTAESGTLWRRLSETETALLLCYRSEPEQIAAPFIAEVFPRKGLSCELFRQIPTKILFELVLSYAAKNASDDLIRSSLESRVSRVVASGEINRTLGSVNSTIKGDPELGTEDFAARLGNAVYLVAFPYVRECYERRLSKEFHPWLQKTFSRKENRPVSSKILDDYKHEYGNSSLSSDVEKLREKLSSKEHPSSRDEKVQQLGSIIKKHIKEVFEIVNQLKFGELDELDEDEQKKFGKEDSLFKEEVAATYTRWFNLTSLEINEALRKAVDEFSLEQVTPEYVLERLEGVIAEYAKKEVPKSEEPSRLVANLNLKYMNRIFSAENVSEDFPAICKDISPMLSSLAGKAALALLKDIDPHQIHQAVSEASGRAEPHRELDESFLAKTYASALASVLSRKIVSDRLLPVVAARPEELVNAYVHFKAEHAAFRDNLFSKAQDIIYGDEFSFIIYSTTGAFINTGKKVLGEESGEREGPRKYALVRLSDAVNAMPPPLDASVDIVYKLCDSLRHLHRKGKEHNGITLNNILLSEDVYELLVFGYNPEKKYSPSCFSLPGIRGQDLFAAASILYTLIEGHVPFRSSDPATIKDDIISKRFRKKARRTPRKTLKLIGEVFNNSISNTNYSVSDFKQKLAKASGRFPSRSYYSFKDYIDRLSSEHKEQVDERLEKWA